MPPKLVFRSLILSAVTSMDGSLSKASVCPALRSQSNAACRQASPPRMLTMLANIEIRGINGYALITTVDFRREGDCLGASDFGEIGIGGFQGGNQRVLEQFRQFLSLKGIAEIKVVIFQGGHAGQNEVVDGFLHAQRNRKIN